MPAVHRRPEAGGSRLSRRPHLSRTPGPAGRSIGFALLAAVCLTVGAVPAAAQSDSVFTVGAAFSVYRSTDEHVESPIGIGIVTRLRRSSGLGFTLGLNWVSATVNTELEGENVRLGRLVMRPLMGGVAYTRQYARFALSGSLVAGYSFNGLRKTGGLSDLYAQLGQPGTRFEVSDSFVYRPSFSVWWDLGRRWGLLTSVSYMATRPEVTTISPAGTSRRRVNFAAPFVTFGIGYGVF